MDWSSEKDRQSFIPENRIKNVIKIAHSVEIDPKIPPVRYYRSGWEMERLANAYLDAGSLESAFILYMKFIHLFVKQIRNHPDFSTVNAFEKHMIKLKLREVLPKAESLKPQLLELYKQDYERYLRDEKRKEQDREKKMKAEKPKPVPADPPPNPSHIPEKPPDSTRLHITPVQNLLENLMYPIDALGLGSTKPDISEKAADPTCPPVNRLSKPDLDVGKAYASRRKANRSLFLPGNLISKFITLAQPNTFQNIETCGILAGHVRGKVEELVITHLLVPEQKGTADSCVTEKEEDLFGYQLEHDLITFGWIHTHPTQTAFLSSVDLHTQCSYQVMIPEAIAIVCAPRYSENKFFCLTPSFGLGMIANCDLQGFHPHNFGKELYSVADHVKIDNSLSAEIVDLRNRR